MEFAYPVHNIKNIYFVVSSWLVGTYDSVISHNDTLESWWIVLIKVCAMSWIFSSTKYYPKIINFVFIMIDKIYYLTIIIFKISIYLWNVIAKKVITSKVLDWSLHSEWVIVLRKRITINLKAMINHCHNAI